jgi:mannose-6-phosphate isomerase-like protein (cupin superfamily)
VLTHRRTGERLTVLAHSADELVLEDLWPAAHCVPEHRHPRMSEHWRLLSGRASFSIADMEHVLGAGQEIMAGADVAHSARVIGVEPARVRMTLRPALRWLEVVERLFRGDDPAVLLRTYPDEFAVG